MIHNEAKSVANCTCLWKLDKASQSHKRPRKSKIVSNKRVKIKSHTMEMTIVFDIPRLHETVPEIVVTLNIFVRTFSPIAQF